jgi:hypothetical protein
LTTSAITEKFGGLKMPSDAQYTTVDNIDTQIITTDVEPPTNHKDTQYGISTMTLSDPILAGTTTNDDANTSLSLLPAIQKSNVIKPRDLYDIAVDIRTHTERVAKSFWAIGHLLNEAKQQLTIHGKWLGWLRSNTTFSPRDAQRYMRLAQGYSNTTLLSQLDFSKAYALLAIPETDRDDFIIQTHLSKGVVKNFSDLTTRELESVVNAYLGVAKTNVKPCVGDKEIKRVQKLIGLAMSEVADKTTNPVIRTSIASSLRKTCEDTLQLLKQHGL